VEAISIAPLHMSKIENLFDVLPFKFQRIQTANADSKVASVLFFTPTTARSPSVDVEKSLPPFCIERKLPFKNFCQLAFIGDDGCLAVQIVWGVLRI